MKALKLNGLIHIHPLFFLLAISAVLTGAMMEFLILFTIVFIHELGHYMMARKYKWRVTKIEIWLFGGSVVCEEHNSRPFSEQAHVILAGPIQHIWIFALLYLMQVVNGPSALIDTALQLNGIILLFNLLPIWPLDGGKLLFYVSTQVSSFRRAQDLALSLSFFFILAGGVYLSLGLLWTLPSIWLVSFLLIENVVEWRRKSFTFMRYLLFRSQFLLCTRKKKVIHLNGDPYVRDLLKHVRANYEHCYMLHGPNGSYIVEERDWLTAFFQKKRSDLRMSEIMPEAG